MGAAHSGRGRPSVVQFSGASATWPVTAIWGLLIVIWGYIGLCVLRMKLGNMGGIRRSSGTHTGSA